MILITSLFLYSLSTKVETLFVYNQFVVLNSPVGESIKIIPPMEFTLNSDTLLFSRFPEETVMIVYERILLNNLKLLPYTYELHKIPLNKTQKMENHQSQLLKIRGYNSLSLSNTTPWNLSQGLNLHLNGEIEKLKIRGVIRDENLALKGYERLSEIDEVFMEIEGKSLYSRVGLLDFEFEDIKKKSRGIQLKLTPRGIGTEFFYLIPQGEFTIVRIRTKPYYNGPYFLDSLNPVRIIPGTEKVFFDNIPLQKNSSPGYSVDYFYGTITLTPDIVPTGNEFITVEFNKIAEANPLQIRGFNFKFPNNQWEITYLHEFDSYDYLKNILDKENLDKILNSPDTSDFIWLEGGIYVGQKNGDYIKVDSYFVYVGPFQGDYRLTFYYTGPNQGDYVYNETNHSFQYVGKNNGNYLPKFKLKIPKNEKNIIIRGNLIKNFNVSYYIKQKKKWESAFKFGYYLEGGWGSLSLAYSRRKAKFKYPLNNSFFSRELLSFSEVPKNLDSEFHLINLVISLSPNQSWGNHIDISTLKIEAQTFSHLSHIFRSKCIFNSFFTTKNITKLKDKRLLEFRNFSLLEKNFSKFSVSFGTEFIKVDSSGVLKMSASLSQNSFLINFMDLWELPRKKNTKILITSFKKDLWGLYIKSLQQAEKTNVSNINLKFKGSNLSYELNYGEGCVGYNLFKFRYIGEGQGNFRYDELSNSFVVDPHGDHILEPDTTSSRGEKGRVFTQSIGWNHLKGSLFLSLNSSLQLDNLQKLKSFNFDKVISLSKIPNPQIRLNYSKERNFLWIEERISSEVSVNYKIYGFSLDGERKKILSQNGSYQIPDLSRLTSRVEIKGNRERISKYFLITQLLNSAGSSSYELSMGVSMVVKFTTLTPEVGYGWREDGFPHFYRNLNQRGPFLKISANAKRELDENNQLKFNGFYLYSRDVKRFYSEVGVVLDF